MRLLAYIYPIATILSIFVRYSIIFRKDKVTALAINSQSETVRSPGTWGVRIPERTVSAVPIDTYAGAQEVL